MNNTGMSVKMFWCTITLFKYNSIGTILSQYAIRAQFKAVKCNDEEGSCLNLP